MRIIIDGPDGTGKSTLVKKLKEYYNIDSIRLSYKDPKHLQFYSSILDKTDCIFDRQFLSELVYSTLFGRECQISDNDVIKLLNKCKNENIKIFILDTETNEIERRLDERGDEHPHIRNNIGNLQEMFKVISNLYNIEIIDTTKVSFEEIVRRIENEEYKSNKSK